MKNIIVCLLLALCFCQCKKSCETCHCGSLQPQLFERRWEFSGFSEAYFPNYYNEQVNLFIPHDSMIRPIWIQFSDCGFRGQLESSEIYGHLDSPIGTAGFGKLVVDFPLDTLSIPQHWDRQFVNRLPYSFGFRVDSSQGMILRYNIGSLGDILVFTPL
jgi:hypothetical protein